MTTIYEIPLSPMPQMVRVPLASGTYQFRLQWRDTAVAGGGGWVLDIGDDSGNPIVCGIALVTGCDLLQQYAYLGLGGSLMVTTDGDPDAPPTFTNLGIDSHLYWITNP